MAGKIQGQRVGSIKKLKQKLKQGGGAGFIKYVPKEGSIMVRFLTEPDDFYGYWEHYDSTIRRSYACVDENCPGCATDEDRNFVYLGAVVNLEDDRVVPLQLKKSVVNDLVLRFEKYDTITDRDYEVGRTGEGKQTRYYVAPEPKSTRKLSKYEIPDLEAVVQAAYEENTALLRDDDDDDDAPKAKPKPPKRPRTPEPVDEDEDDEDEPGADVGTTYSAEDLDDMDEDELTEAAESIGLDVGTFEDWDELRAAILAGGSVAVEDDDDDDEDEDEDDADTEDDEDEDEAEVADADDEDFWTPDELEAMSPGEVKALAKDYNISTRGLTKAQIIEKLLEA